MGMMIIRHKIRDYGQWRPVSIGIPKCRRLQASAIRASTTPPTATECEIVVVFDTKDTRMAKDFAASVDLKEAMAEAGVVDIPTIYFLIRLISARSNQRA